MVGSSSETSLLRLRRQRPLAGRAARAAAAQGGDQFGPGDLGEPDKVMSDKTMPKSVLTYHVVGQKITPDQPSSGNFETLNGAMLKTGGSGRSFTIGKDARVVCGDVQTANATVHIIDGVLMPPK